MYTLLTGEFVVVPLHDENFWLNLVGLHNGDVASEWMIPGDEVMESLEPGCVFQ